MAQDRTERQGVQATEAATRQEPETSYHARRGAEAGEAIYDRPDSSLALGCSDHANTYAGLDFWFGHRNEVSLSSSPDDGSRAKFFEEVHKLFQIKYFCIENRQRYSIIWEAI
jgi:hypothetical protein